MKTEELRIGNIVDLYGKIAKIQRADFSETEHGIAVKEGKPIPLTEEWLLKFGFEKDEDFGNWHLDDYEIYSIKNNSGFRSFICGVKDDIVYWYNDASDDYYSSTKKLPFVHNLQNLYFALTGKELEINKES